MAKKKEKVSSLLKIGISFPKAPKKAKDKKIPFTKLLSLIEKSKESLPVKVRSERRRRYVALDSDEFMFAISFGKSGATIRVRVMVHDPEKNIDIANEVGNKIINFMNTILGEGATEPIVISDKTTLFPEEIPNVCKKIVGEKRIAEINEEVKQILTPIGIFVEYKTDDREFVLASISIEEGAEALLSRITYKGKVPFDLLRKEYDELANPAEILKKLSDVES